jgi:hypothetical protein
MKAIYRHKKTEFPKFRQNLHKNQGFPGNIIEIQDFS